jgi:hypothetical protein
MTEITCSDYQCHLCENGKCIALAIGITSDRFCETGRRRPRDDTAELMQVKRPGCHRQGGYKSDRVRTVR